MTKTQVNFRLDKDLVDRLKLESKACLLSTTQFIEQLLKADLGITSDRSKSNCIRPDIRPDMQELAQDRNQLDLIDFIRDKEKIESIVSERIELAIQEFKEVFMDKIHSDFTLRFGELWEKREKKIQESFSKITELENLIHDRSIPNFLYALGEQAIAQSMIDTLKHNQKKGSLFVLQKLFLKLFPESTIILNELINES